LRLDTGRATARDLSDVLDKTKRFRPEDVPEVTKSNRVVVARVAGHDIVLERQLDAEEPGASSTTMGSLTGGDKSAPPPTSGVVAWRFDRGTVAALPMMSKALRDKPYIAPRQRARLTERVLAALPPALEQEVLGLELWQWSALVLCVLVAWLLGRLLAMAVAAIFVRILRSVDDALSASPVAKSWKPLGLFSSGMALQHVSPLLQLPAVAHGWVSATARWIAVLAALQIGWRQVGLVGELLTLRAERTESKLDNQLVPLVSKGLRLLLLLTAALILADAAGWELTGALATLGLGGVAVALAAKDTVENLFGTVTILLDKPFEVGDLIALGETTGTVERIGFRSTRIRTLHNSQVTVPNSKLIVSEVDNLGRRQRRRFKGVLTMTYGSTPAQLQAYVAGLQTLFSDHPRVDEDFVCGVHEFGAHAIEVHFTAHIRTEVWSDEVAVRQELLLAMLRLTEALGLEFAFPTQTILHAASQPGLQVERVPAQADPMQLGMEAARALPDVARKTAVLDAIAHEERIGASG
jgi:MscS family membrane protein